MGWSDLGNDPNQKFDFSKFTEAEIAQSFSHLSDQQVDEIYAKLDACIKNANRRIAIVEVIKQIGSIALSVVKTIS